jgi:hypothetical protein
MSRLYDKKNTKSLPCGTSHSWDNKQDKEVTHVCDSMARARERAGRGTEVVQCLPSKC